MRHRSNEEWCEALAGTRAERDEALADLRAYVLRAARYYLCGRAPGRAQSAASPSTPHFM